MIELAFIAVEMLTIMSILGTGRSLPLLVLSMEWVTRSLRSPLDVSPYFCPPQLPRDQKLLPVTRLSLVNCLLILLLRFCCGLGISSVPPDCFRQESRLLQDRMKTLEPSLRTQSTSWVSSSGSCPPSTIFCKIRCVRLCVFHRMCPACSLGP